MGCTTYVTRNRGTRHTSHVTHHTSHITPASTASKVPDEVPPPPLPVENTDPRRLGGGGAGRRWSGRGLRLPVEGFGVWGLVFGVWCLGFGVWGLGFRVLGVESHYRVRLPMRHGPTPPPLPRVCAWIYRGRMTRMGRGGVSRRVLRRRRECQWLRGWGLGVGGWGLGVRGWGLGVGVYLLMTSSCRTRALAVNNRDADCT